MRPTVVHMLEGVGIGGNETLCLQIVRHAPPGLTNVVIYQDPAQTESCPCSRPCRICACAASRRMADPGSSALGCSQGNSASFGRSPC